ncbi:MULTISPECIES: hypothetical protein [unclassified Marinitoga]|uniref:hypothetical protein n=1 Tax=unclassified Marinitoga TaxID=2640159 RepID=UPI0006414785|nr:MULTISPECIES: hypothetical protein [unclassified Marinitoga]KLO20954.1 hypothetical protein X274_11405 [Marinitoga sp. 1155]NUV00072.1 hypothetical protein [Marinitoga sp. 1154]
MKKTSIILFIFIIGILTFSNPTINKPWNYSFNPALFDYGTRNLIDIGGNLTVDFEQPFINFGDFFKEEMIIDFNEIYDNLKGENLDINLEANALMYGKLHLWMFSYAKSFNLYSNTKLSLPNDLIKLISYGNVENGDLVDLSGEGIINTDILLEDNNYFSWIGKNSIIGINISNFAPVAVLRGNITFKQTPDIENATLNIDYSLSGKVYSSFGILDKLIDNGNMDLGYNDIMKYSGTKISIGYISKKDRWGVSLNDIVLNKAKVKYEYTLEATGNLNVADLKVISDNATPIIEKISETLDKEYPEISLDLPMNISAFYTFNFLFDITPHLQYFFEKGLAWGINIDGNLLFIPFWFDISNNIDYWSLNTGFGINLHILDLNVSVKSNTADFGDVFDFNNLSFELNVAAGI